ncbi:MAG: hypothetical protein V4482_05840 [Pseudomonadota bacterium]
MKLKITTAIICAVLTCDQTNAATIPYDDIATQKAFIAQITTIATEEPIEEIFSNSVKRHEQEKHESFPINNELSLIATDRNLSYSLDISRFLSPTEWLIYRSLNKNSAYPLGESHTGLALIPTSSAQTNKLITEHQNQQTTDVSSNRLFRDRKPPRDFIELMKSRKAAAGCKKSNQAKTKKEKLRREKAAKRSLISTTPTDLYKLFAKCSIDTSPQEE